MANGASNLKRAASGILGKDGMPTQALLDSLTIGVCAVDTGGRVVSLNREAERLLGWTEAGVVGESLHDLIRCSFPIETAGLSRCPVEEVLRTGQALWSPQTRVRSRDGSTKEVEYKCVPLGRGRDFGAVITLRDLTHQLRLEADRNHLASIPEESPFPIVEMDADANLLYANPAMTELLERFSYTDAGLPAVLPPDTPEIVRGCLVSGTSQQDIELTHGGVSYSWAFHPIPSSRQVRSYGIDVTEIRGAQRNLQDFAERMERANVELELALRQAGEAARIKSYFLATMSHELRTPMNGVIGLTNFLLETELNPEQRSYVELVQQSGEALLALINDILDVSKMEAGKLELEWIDFSIDALLDEMLGLFAEKAQGKGVELVWNADASVPQVLQGDPARLRQILTNLIGNALKFTEEGEVSIEVACDHQGAAESTDTITPIVVRFAVRDTGVGINPDAVGKLFQAFSQADSSTTRKYGGTGLGLAISKQLAEIMGGEIGVETEVDRGSTFWFSVRLAVNANASPPPVPPEFHGKRVLVVDDSPTVGRAFQTRLARWGIRTAVASDAERALVMLHDAGRRQEPYDAVLVDFTLPDKTALGLVRDCREHPGLAKTPFVMLTGFGQRAHEVVSRHAGVTVCLPKPVRSAPLQDGFAQVWGLCLHGSTQERPASAAGAAEAGKESAGPAANSGVQVQRRILVIEDNAVNQKVAVRMLEKQGYLVEVAPNGRAGVEAWAKGAFDAILMDCQMPEMDGFEATRAIRTEERVRGSRSAVSGEAKDISSAPDPVPLTLNHIPIIAMTANALEGDRERCLASGMDDYLDKPVKSDKLRAILGRWLENRTED